MGAWAMRAGTEIFPAWYPVALLKEEARFEDFQAWLHQIHHGSCPQPCMTTSAPTAPTAATTAAPTALATEAPTPAPTLAPTSKAPTPAPTWAPMEAPQYVKLGDGPCRTASGGKGTYAQFTPSKGGVDSQAKCEARCSSDAYEWKYSTGDDCEIHTEEVVDVSGDSKHRCY